MCGRTWQLITTRVKLGLCSAAKTALFSAWPPLWLGLNYFIQNEGLFRLMKSLIKTLPWNNPGPCSTQLKPPQALLVHCLLFSIVILNRDDIDAPFWPFGRVRSPTCLWLVGAVAWESRRSANHVFQRWYFTMDLFMLLEEVLLGLATSFESLQHRQYNKRFFCSLPWTELFELYIIRRYFYLPVRRAESYKWLVLLLLFFFLILPTRRAGPHVPGLESAKFPQCCESRFQRAKGNFRAAT